MDFCVNLVRSIVGLVHRSTHNHYRSFFTHLDMVKASPEDLFRPFNVHYLYGMILFLSSIIYGTFGLVALADPNSVRELMLDKIWASPYHYVHVMFLREMWREGEGLWAPSVVEIIITLGALYCLMNPPHEGSLIPISNEQSKFTKKEHKSILAFRRKLLRVLHLTNRSVFVFGHALLYSMVYLNGTYTGGVVSAVFWLLFLPIFMLYASFCTYVMPFFVVLSSGYVGIRQKFLTRNFDTILRSTRRKSSIPYSFGYLDFLKLNRRILDICHVQSEYGHFWSTYLTILFGALISHQCFYTYIILFTDIPFIVMRIIFIGLVLNMFSIELMLIGSCAQVVKWNRRLLRQNQKYQQTLYSNRAVHNRQISARNLFKVDSLCDSRLLYRYAFRIFGNHRISSKTFPLMFSYISAFFIDMMSK